MPYRLFRPCVEPGRRYPLVLFLHGSGGSGTDNVMQLDRTNWFGGLVWALPEKQKRHPCFVVAPQSNENWPAVHLIEGQLPEILPGPGRSTRNARTSVTTSSSGSTRSPRAWNGSSPRVAEGGLRVSREMTGMDTKMGGKKPRVTGIFPDRTARGHRVAFIMEY